MAHPLRFVSVAASVLSCLFACTAQTVRTSSDWSNVMSLPSGSELIVMTRGPFHCELAYADPAGVVCERRVSTAFGAMDRSFAIGRNEIRSVELQRTHIQASRRNDGVKAGALGGLALGALAGLLAQRHTTDEGRTFIGSAMAGTAVGGAVGWMVQHKHAPKPQRVYVAPPSAVVNSNTSTNPASLR